jgi:hypothetical protein
MQENYEEVYKTVVTAVLASGQALEMMTTTRPTSVGDLADKLFAMRECIKRLEGLVRDFKKTEDTVEKLFIAIFLASSQKDMNVKTEYVTAEPVPSQGTRVPRRHEPCYKEFLSFLGIPKEVQDCEVLAVHYPGWCTYYTALQARGEDVPESLKSFLTEYETSTVKTRKRQSMKGSIDVQRIDETGDTGETSVPF